MPDPQFKDGTWCYYCGEGRCICHDDDDEQQEEEEHEFLQEEE